MLRYLSEAQKPRHSETGAAVVGPRRSGHVHMHPIPREVFCQMLSDKRALCEKRSSFEK